MGSATPGKANLDDVGEHTEQIGGESQKETLSVASASVPASSRYLLQVTALTFHSDGPASMGGNKPCPPQVTVGYNVYHSNRNLASPNM